MSVRVEESFHLVKGNQLVTFLISSLVNTVNPSGCALWKLAVLVRLFVPFFRPTANIIGTCQLPEPQ
jgi:hypothetical protein